MYSRLFFKWKGLGSSSLNCTRTSFSFFPSPFSFLSSLCTVELVSGRVGIEWWNVLIDKFLSRVEAAFACELAASRVRFIFLQKPRYVYDFTYLAFTTCMCICVTWSLSSVRIHRCCEIVRMCAFTRFAKKNWTFLRIPFCGISTMSSGLRRWCRVRFLYFLYDYLCYK